MVEAFGAWNLCPAGRLRQKKRRIWPQTFLKNKSGEESEQTSLALSCLRWAYSIAGLWVLFFLFHVWWVARLQGWTWTHAFMAFKNDLSLSLFGKISLNEEWSEENVRNVSYACVRCSRFFLAAVSLISRVQLTIEWVYKRSRKTKLGNLSKIIHQKLPIFDRNFFIKARKNSLIF